MMGKAFLFVRSSLFAVAFYGATALHVLAALALTPCGPRVLHRIIHHWSRTHRLLCRIMLGQKVRVVGTVPPGQHFYVLKHESMFETIDLMQLVDAPVIVAKQELLDIPGWGRLAQRYGMIGLKRATGSAALRHLKRQAKMELATGRSICLFPEGTRVPHGERPPLKAGFAAMYQLLGLSVVPVAIDSGRVSPRHSFLKHPGIITYHIGETIPTGLSRAEAEARAYAAINALNPPLPVDAAPAPGGGHSQSA
ncbi:MAG: lysophospholipid acyltransferase family protein [Sphingobium sp.]